MYTDKALNNVSQDDAADDLSLARRTFLKGAGLVTALSAVPWAMRQAYAEQPFDVIVIGGGTAGIPTAIFAADRGARVVIIEKAPSLGGTLFLSGGKIAGANTVYQKAKGIKDSPDAHYDDVMRISNNTADPILTRLWVDNAGATINWLAENGFTVGEDHPVAGFRYEPYSTPRYQWGAANGLSILRTMEPLLTKHIRAGRVTVLTSAGAVDLIKDQAGTTIGVLAEDSDGKRSDIRGKNVVITSGGYASNPVMFENLQGVPLYSRVAYPHSQGTGLSLGQRAGGYLRGADNLVSYYGAILADTQIPSARIVNMAIEPEHRAPWEVFVNSRGERFVQEDHPLISTRDRAMDLQPGHRFWAIFDQRILEQAPPLIPTWTRERFLDAFNKHPMFTRAVSLSELAVACGIDPMGVEQSIREYNEAIAQGRRDKFDRTSRPLPITTAPFYAVRSQAWTLKSYAGLAVNKSLQLMTRDGGAIKNVYAAGEVLGAPISGRAHVGGASVTPALTFGRLLGKTIIQF